MTLLPYSPHSEPQDDEPRLMRSDLIAPIESARRSKTPIIVSLILILFLFGAAAAYYFLIMRKVDPQVTLSYSLPDKAMVGEQFTLAVSYGNDSKDPLEETKVSISLPEGVVLVGDATGKRFDEEDIGELGQGVYGKQTFDLMALSGSETVKRIPVKLRYSLKGTKNHEFSTSQTASIAIGEPAIDVSFNAPQNVISGQAFDVSFDYHNNSRSIFNNVRLVLDYPPAFHFVQATSTPAVQNSGSTWTIGDLPPNATGTVIVAGTAAGSAPNFSIGAKILADIKGQTYTLWSGAPVIGLGQAPLALNVSVNGDPNFIAHPGDDLRYLVRYKNNASVALQDVVLKLTLKSTLIDPTRLLTKGTFDSRTGTITWNGTNTASLQSIPPGGEEILDVSVPLISQVPIRRIGDKNFVVEANASIESPTVPPGTEAEKTISYAALSTKIAGDIALSDQLYYAEPNKSIKNSGPFPLQANKATRFTFHWRLKNSITDMTAVHVSAKFAPGVTWTNAATSTLGGAPQYDPHTGEVSWDVPRVAATLGVLGAQPEAIFQIEITPAVNQVGQSVDLVGESTLSATDDFTALKVSRSAPAVSSNALGDGRVR